MRINTNGVIDLSSLRAPSDQITLGQAFTFFSRQSLKASPILVAALLEVESDPGSTKQYMSVVCDGLVCKQPVTFDLPVRTLFDPAKHTEIIRIHADGWVAQLPGLFAQQASKTPERFLGFPLPQKVMEGINGFYVTLARRKAAAEPQRIPGEVIPEKERTPAGNGNGGDPLGD